MPDSSYTCQAVRSETDRCWQSTFAAAQAICEHNDGSLTTQTVPCYGITKDQYGYEPRGYGGQTTDCLAAGDTSTTCNFASYSGVYAWVMTVASTCN